MSPLYYCIKVRNYIKLFFFCAGMRDYVTPLEELITVLANALAVLGGEGTLSPNMVTLGNKVLVYVSCCLAGRGYPQGDIEPEYTQQVRGTLV